MLTRLGGLFVQGRTGGFVHPVRRDQTWIPAPTHGASVRFGKGAVKNINERPKAGQPQGARRASPQAGQDRLAVEGPGANRQDGPDQRDHDQVAEHDLVEGEGRLAAEELGDRDTDDR